MRKILTLVLSFVTLASAFATTGVTPSSSPAPSRVVKPTDIILPVGATCKFINLQELANIKVADYEKLSGKKMHLLDRLEFKLAQRKLRNSINDDGTVNNSALTRTSAKKDIDGETGFHLGGFALGFLLGLIGVLIAYVIHDEKRHNRTKWAWIGFVVFVVVYVALVI